MSSRRLVVATQNAGKLREIRDLLSALDVEWSGLRAEWADSLPEEGKDYEANARAKAISVARVSQTVTVADDSGLEVAALGGAPGPLSARYGGAGLDDAGRNRHLLDALREVPPGDRAARFVCVAAVATPDGACAVTQGVCSGRILEEPRGGAGFGYDPLFWVEARGCAVAELSDADKQALSHRGRAFRRLLPAIREGLAGRGIREPGG